MQRYFSHICDVTNVQADWRSWTYGRAPNAIDISWGSLTCPSYTDTGQPFLYGDSDTLPQLVAFYDHAGYTEDVFSTYNPGILMARLFYVRYLTYVKHALINFKYAFISFHVYHSF